MLQVLWRHLFVLLRNGSLSKNPCFTLIFWLLELHLQQEIKICILFSCLFQTFLTWLFCLFDDQGNCWLVIIMNKEYANNFAFDSGVQAFVLNIFTLDKMKDWIVCLEQWIWIRIGRYICILHSKPVLAVGNSQTASSMGSLRSQLSCTIGQPIDPMLPLDHQKWVQWVQTWLAWFHSLIPTLVVTNLEIVNASWKNNKTKYSGSKKVF